MAQTFRDEDLCHSPGKKPLSIKVLAKVREDMMGIADDSY